MDIDDIVTILVRDLEYDGHDIEYGNGNSKGQQICIDGKWILIQEM